MKRIVLMMFIAGMFVFSSHFANACWCILPGVRESFDKAGAVFVGEVVEILEPKTKDENAPLSDRLYTIKFKVERSFKGVPFREISVLSGHGKFNCFSYPEVFTGERLLVYANPPYENGGYAKGSLMISDCANRTGILSQGPGRNRAYSEERDSHGRRYAVTDLRELEEIANPTHKLQPDRKNRPAPNKSINRTRN